MKYFKLIIIALMFTIILIPIIFINLNPDQISEIDNKKLPEAKSIKNIKTFNEYISKRIGFRNKFINAYTEANDKLLNKMIHPTYSYGKDGYIFYKTDIEKHDDTYLNTFAKMIKDLQTYVTDRGSYFLFVINPTKISVYSQYLPEGYIFTNYRINYLKEKLNELEVNYIDNTQCLIDASKTEQVYNVKYDAGHWNETGAFIGLNNIYKRMQEDGIKINLLDMEDYQKKYEHVDTLPSSNFAISEDIPQYTIKTQNYTFTKIYKEYIDISKTHSTYLETQNEKVNNNYTMLFFRGSYMGGKEKFIANVFNKVYYVHNYDNVINFDYYYNITLPDIVLFEGAEYAIGDSYYSEKNMKKKIVNVCYDKLENINEETIDNVETEKIKDAVKTAIASDEKANTPIVKITIPNGGYDYAYLKVKDKIYDFNYIQNKTSISLDKKIINDSKELDVILIKKADNKTKKQVIRVQID